MKISKNGKNFFLIDLNNIFSKVAGSRTVTCSLITYRHADRHTDTHQSDYREKPFQGFGSALPSANHQGAVQSCLPYMQLNQIVCCCVFYNHRLNLPKISRSRIFALFAISAIQVQTGVDTIQQHLYRRHLSDDVRRLTHDRLVFVTLTQ